MEAESNCSTKKSNDYEFEFKWIGDDLLGMSHSEDTRFVLSNCKGLRLKYDTNFIKSQIQSYLCAGSHFTALTEINLNILPYARDRPA